MLALITAGIIGFFLSPVVSAEDKARDGNNKVVDLYGDPLPSGAVARLGTYRFRHQNRVHLVAFSPDGKTIASCGGDRVVLIWDAATGKILHRLVGHTNSINGLAFSGDGKMLASSSRMNGQIILWDPLRGTRIRELPSKFTVPWVAFSPDNKLLAVVSERGTHLLDPATGAERGNIKEQEVYWTAFTSDGKTIVSAGQKNSPGSSVRLWNAATRKEIRSFRWERIYSAALSPDGKMLAAGNKNGSIRVWDVESGAVVREFPSIGTDLVWNAHMVFSPDSKLLATVGNTDISRAIRILSLESGKEAVRCSGHPTGASSVAFSPDGARLVSGGLRGRVRVWDAKTGKETVRILSHLGDVRSVSFLPDGRSVVTKSIDGTIRLWDGPTGNLLSTLRAHWRWGISPDGRLMAAVGNDNLVRLLDMETGQVLPLLGGHQRFVEHFTFSPDGKTLASLDEVGVLRVWDVNEGKPTITFDSPVESGAIMFSPDGKTLASAGGATLTRNLTGSGWGAHDFPIRLWEAATGKKLADLGASDDPVTSLAFSPDGRLLASGHGVLDKTPRYISRKRILPPKSSNTARLWHLKTSKLITDLKAHADAVSSVAFSPDGKVLASGSLDGTIRLWEVAGGKERRKLEGHGVPGLKGIEQAGIFSIDFSPDGKFLVSGSQDGTVLVWNVNEVTKQAKPADKNKGAATPRKE
jgi:WD40 repeat protein